MDDVQAVARTWLQHAEALGWGVEGPPEADAVATVIRALARGDDPEEAPPALTEDEELGLRPVDALRTAARLLLEASLTGGATRRDELVSAASGWLRIASGR